MKRFFRRIKRILFFYLTLKEMRMFWLLFIMLMLLGGLNMFYVSDVHQWTIAGAFVVLAIVLFVTYLRLARTNYEVRLERTQINTIVANLHDAIIAYDPDFTIAIFNKAAESLFDISADDIIGETFSPNSIKKKEHALLTQVLFPALAPTVARKTDPDQYPQEVHLSFEEPRLELRVITSKIEDENGKLLGFFKAVHDETRERALLKSKTEFITVAAHQLRTPLSAINWIFQGFQSGSFGEVDESQKEVLETGFKAAKKLSKTVDDLLDVSRIEEGRFGYDFQEIDLIELAKKVLDPYVGIAQDNKVKLYFDDKTEGDLPKIKADPVRVSLVLQILLDNALKYNVENGEIIVTVKKSEKDDSYIEMSVKDTGIGIPDAEKEKLFTKFFRAENVLKYETEGSGLGLYIARNIVHRHGGEIWAESIEDRGSTFYFTLPMDENLIPRKESAMEDFY